MTLLLAVTAVRAQDQTVSGNLTVTGNATINGATTVSTLIASGGTLTGGSSGLTLNAGGTNQSITLLPSGTGSTILNGTVGVGTSAPLAALHLADASGTPLMVDEYITSGVGSMFRGRKARGTIAAPRRVVSSDVLAGLSGFGAYASDDSTDAVFPGTGSGFFRFHAAESFTSTGRGTYFSLVTTAIGSTTTFERLRVTDSGNVGIGTATPTALLDVAGGANVVGNVAVGGDLTVTGALNVNGAAGYQQGGATVLKATGGSGGNTAVGVGALASNTTGTLNTALGRNALNQNTTGFSNLAFGDSALAATTTGSANLAFGSNALALNTSGGNNVAIGTSSLANVITGVGNVAAGRRSGWFATGNNNLFLGFQAGSGSSSGSNNIVIGTNINAPSASDSNQLTIGNLIFGTGLDGTGTTVSSGNIGIGTATPSARLDVVGGANVSGDVSVGGNITVSGALNAPNFSTSTIASSASLTLASGGTNQDITLDPSGTGTVRVVMPGGQDLRFSEANAATPLISSSGNLKLATGSGSSGSITIATNGGGTQATFAASGGIDLTAQGTNQNITLTPSGTGATVLNGNTTLAGNATLNGSLSGVIPSVTLWQPTGSNVGVVLNQSGGGVWALTNKAISGPTQAVFAIQNGGIGGTDRFTLDADGNAAVTGNITVGGSITGTLNNPVVFKSIGNDTGVQLRQNQVFDWGLTNKANTGTFSIQSGGIGGTDRLSIDQSGNVGIGTSSPGAKLDVAGVARTQGVQVANLTNAPLLGTDASGNLTSVTASSLTLSSSQLTTALGFTPANKAGDTLSGNLRLMVGTTTVAPLTLQSGTNLTTPTFGAVEFDGTNVFVTNNVASPTRKTLAFSATTLSGYGITDPVVLTSGSYADPTWITSLAAGKIAGVLSASALPAHTGDVTSTAGSAALTLANSGVTAGTYAKVTVDAKGRVTAGANLASGDVTTALGFTPYNATNPSGYITSAGVPVQSVFGRTGAVTLASGDVTTALNFTPANKAGDTLSGNLRLMVGTTTVAPLTLQSGTNLTTPTFGAVEFDGTNIFITNNAASPTRKTLAYAATTLSGYGITDPVVLTSGSYADPTWITSLAAGKIAGVLSASALPAHTGDVTSTAGSAALTLANSGVTAGTYAKVTVDAKGRVTAGANLASGDVTTALGFTPYNATNPSGYITSAGVPVQSVFGRTGAVTLASGDVTTALNFTPANKAGDTLSGNLRLMVGTTTVAPLTLQSGTNLTTPTFGAVEFDGTNVFVTNNVASPTRKTLAFSATTLSGYGITDPVVLTSGSYADPTWITSLAAGKIAGVLSASALPAHTGDVTSAAGSAALTLANSGVTAGTYAKVTVDAKGRVTAGANLASGDVTTALGFTPYNATNPSGYITSAGVPVQSVFGRTGAVTLTSADVTTALNGTLTGASGGLALSASDSGGANLVLGSGANGSVVITPAGAGAVNLFKTGVDSILDQTTTTSGQAIHRLSGFSTSTSPATTSGGGDIYLRNLSATDGNFSWVGAQSSAGNAVAGTAYVTKTHATPSGYMALFTRLSGNSLAEAARLTDSGNLLVGGTTDMSGSGGLKLFGTTASTSTTTGALQVAGGAGIGGDVFVGGLVRPQRLRLEPNNIFTSDGTYGIDIAVPVQSNANLSIIKGVNIAQTISGATAVNYTGYSLYPTDASTAASLITGFGVNLNNVTNPNATVYGVRSTVSSGANRWGIYADGTAKNLFGGSVQISDATASTSPTTGALQVAGGVGVAGNLNVGGNLAVTGTFSAPNYTASSGTFAAGSGQNLTAAAGSSGANLVLGQGANGTVTVTPTGTGTFDVASAVMNLNTGGNSGASRLGLLTQTGSGQLYLTGADLRLYAASAGGTISFETTGGSPIARFTNPGNLLIGGTADIAGSGGLKVFGTTAATSTTTGALQVAGGVGVGGAGYFGSNLTVSGTGTNTMGGVTQFAGDDKLSVGWVSATDQYILGANYLNNNGTESVTNTARGSWRSVMRVAGSPAITWGWRAGSAGAGTFTDMWSVTSSGNGTLTGNLTVSGTGTSSFAGALDSRGAVTFGASADLSSGTAAGQVQIARTTAGGQGAVLQLSNRSTSNDSYSQIGMRGLTSAGAEQDYVRVLMSATNTTTRDGSFDVHLASGGAVGSIFKVTPSAITMLPTTPSTSTTTGALQVAGGAGIAGNLNVGGTINGVNLASGALTGGNSGLTLNAGGSNQNITLTPGGTGSVLVNSDLSLGSYSTRQKLAVGGSVIASGYPYTANGVANGATIFTSETAPAGNAGVIGVGGSGVAIKTNPFGNAFGAAGTVGAASNAGGGRGSVGLYGYSVFSNTGAQTNTANNVAGAYDLSELTNAVTDFRGNLYGTYARADASAAAGSVGGYATGVYGTAVGRAVDTVYGGQFSATGGVKNYGVYSSAGDNYFNSNVGIGTTTPGSLLDVSRGTQPNGDLATFQTTNASGGFSQISLRHNVSGGTDSRAVWGIDGNGTWFGGSSASSNLRLFTGGSERVRLQADGKVGIGTSTPASALEVAGDATFGSLSGANNGAVNINSGSTGLARLMFNPGVANNRGFIDYDAATKGMIFRTNEAEALRIAANGNVGIGTTTPATKLDVLGNATVSGRLAVGSLQLGNVTLDPSSLITSAGGTINGSLAANQFTAGGIAGNGGSGANGVGLTISSGGTDEQSRDIVLDPFGQGDVVITAGNKLKMNGAAQRSGEINIGLAAAGNATVETALLDFGTAASGGSLHGSLDATGGAVWQLGYRAAAENAQSSFVPGLTLLSGAQGAALTINGTIAGTNGLELLAGGNTNKDLTLTPAGTGQVVIKNGGLQLANNVAVSFLNNAGARRPILSLDSSENLALGSTANAGVTVAAGAGANINLQPGGKVIANKPFDAADLVTVTSVSGNSLALAATGTITSTSAVNVVLGVTQVFELSSAQAKISKPTEIADLTDVVSNPESVTAAALLVDGGLGVKKGAAFGGAVRILANGNLNVAGPTTLGSTTIGGPMVVNQSATFNNSVLNANGGLSTNGAALSAGNTIIGGTALIGGAAEFRNGLSFSAANTVNGNTTVTNVGRLTWPTTGNDPLNLIAGDNRGLFLSVGNATNLGLKIQSSGDMTASGKVGVGGPSTLTSVLTLGTSAPEITTDTDTNYVAISGGTAKSSANAASIELSGNGRTQLGGDVSIAAGNVTGGDIHFATGGVADRVVITDAGKVGIGTNNPSATLAVSGDQNVTGSVTVNSSGNSSGGLIVGSADARTGGNIRLISQQNSWGLENDDGTLKFYRENAAGGSKSIATSMNADATVQFQGRVTTTQGLTVSNGGISVSTGDIALNAGRITGVATAATTDGTSAANVTYVNAQVPFAWNRTSHTVVLKDEADKLGLGTTAPGYRLDVLDGGGMRLDGLTSGNGLLLRRNASAANQTWKLGVGVNADQKTFTIADVSGNADRLAVTAAGRVGIGTAEPQAALHVVAPPVGSPDTSSGAQVIIDAPQNSEDHYLLFRNSWSAADRSAGFATVGFKMSSGHGGSLWFGTKPNSVDQSDHSGQPAKRMIIDPSGHVGIGVDDNYFTLTGNNEYKLSVAGKVHAQEVVVDLVHWSDYVFDDKYRNAPLSEVEQHIKEHKHLPGVPSAKQVAEKGVNVGEMQAVLLAKVEELTLHMIEQEKRIKRLEAENAALKTALP